jgi:hypothetical protein
MTTALDQKRTHVLWAARRFGRRGQVELLECGYGWIDQNGVPHSYLNRTPFAGFTGYTQLVPHGVEPVIPTQFEKPQRPGSEGEDDEEESGD